MKGIRLHTHWALSSQNKDGVFWVLSTYVKVSFTKKSKLQKSITIPVSVFVFW